MNKERNISFMRFYKNLIEFYKFSVTAINMQYGTHILGGILSGVLINPTPQGILISTVGSLFPDIDHPDSFIGKRIKILSVPISKVFKHRTVTHSPLIWGLLEGINLITINNENLTYFICGVFSHIILDMLNSSGVPVFYPISKKRTNLAKIKLGGIGEKLISVGLSFTIIALSYLS